MKTKSPFWAIGLVISLSVVMLALFYRVYAATTISNNSITTGAINASSNADFTLGASNRVLVDAASTDTTVTTGVLDLNVDAGAANATAQDTTFIIQGDYLGFGQKINLASGANLGASTWQYGQAIYLGGRSTGASSSGLYVGSAVFPQTSTNNASDYIGYLSAFDSSYTTALGGTGLDVTGSGNVNAFSANIKKTSAGGLVRGIEINLANQTAAATGVYGVDMTLDVSGNPGESKGILIQETGSSGTLQDGVKISGDVTDGIDVSATNIVNAINIGNNTILGNDSAAIDLNKTAATTLTVTNSNTDASALASVAIEGGVTIGNNGSNPGTAITKHLSTTSSIDVGQPIGGGCETSTVTLSGASSGDTVVATPQHDTGGTAFSALDAVWSAWANTDQVRLRICAPGNQWSYNPQAVTWRFDVWQH